MQSAGLKSGLRRAALWAGLLLILLLILLSIYGAFIGAESAKGFFNSIPLAVYWLAFAILLISAIALFRRLLCFRGLFLIHLGCIIILAGGIIGSKAGFKIQDKLFGTDTIRTGQMIINEGTTERAVELEDGVTKTLSFAIKLVDFKIEYYQPGQLIIRTPNGDGFKISAEQGQKYVLGDELGSIEIVRRFDNFKLTREGDKRIAIDDANGGPNPALELLLKNSDGSEKTRYVFERFAGHSNPDDTLSFSYRLAVRTYISDVGVVKDNKIIVRKSIEVNKPLHYGGYLFYQQGYDTDAGRYTVLGVTSDKGLGIVFLGYILLCAGVFWHFWLRHIFGDREIED
ncbi:MAG: cytochrome c biogenesis protein ResB [Sedimentisphaerales bacterium]